MAIRLETAQRRISSRCTSRRTPRWLPARRPRKAAARTWRLRLEQLEARHVLSAMWTAVFRGFSPGGTLEEQARYGQDLLASYGIADESVHVVQALDFSGTFLVATPDDVTEEMLEEELEDIPGFAMVEENEGAAFSAMTPDGTFQQSSFPFDIPSDDLGLPAPTGTWTTTTVAPATAGTMILLSNGNVLVQGGGVTNNWFQLKPSATGDYATGTWSQVATMGTQRLYFGTNVLPDGRVFLLGGEYSGSSGGSDRINTGEIYDPVANTWTAIAPFPRASFGDGQSEILPDGRVLAGYLSSPETYIYDPATNTWSAGGSKLHNDRNNEETWNLLPDGSILTYDVFSSAADGIGHSQRYVPSTNTWVDAGNLPVLLSSSSLGSEMGPALLLPDGRVFMVGANNKTALYTPATATSPQFWTEGPSLPANLGADDAPGAILPNGHVIFAVDTSVPAIFTAPTRLFDFDPVTNSLAEVTGQPGFLAQLTTDLNHAAFTTRMLMLPSGQMLFAPGSSSRVYIYTPDGGPDPAWRPTISTIATGSDGSYTLTGTQLNGISEGASYGDDAEMSTNYPIVQLKNATTGNVYYGRTFNWSNTGVATGSLPVSTQFTLPVGLPAGNYSLAVVANGIASLPVAFNVPLAVTSSTPADKSVVVSSPPANYVINFSSAVDPASLQAGDLLVNGLPADGVVLDAAHTSATFTFSASPVVNQGVQTIAIVAGSISSDGDPGSTIAAYYATFRYDSPVLAVTTTVPAAGGLFTLPSPITYVVNFNEPIEPNSLSTDDLTVSVGTVSDVEATGPSQATYTITNVTAEGSITITLGAGKVTDAWGNPNTAAFGASFTVDYGTTPYPTPLLAKKPPGSLIYDPSIPANIQFLGDTDTFTLAVDPGQTITVLVTPSASGVQPSVQLLDPSNVTLGSTTSAAPNLNALLQTVPTTTSGTYSIVVSGGNSTTGGYAVQVYLNAAVESANAGFATNNSRATAQDLTLAFVNLQTGQAVASRGAVIGGIKSSATLTAVDSGWWDISGAHTSTNSNYIVGRTSTPNEFRNYFIFDLSTAGQAVTAAQLNLFNPSGGYAGNATETYTLFDVSTPLAALDTTSTGQTAIFSDLGTGTSFGSRNYSSADNNTTTSIPLNASAVTALNAALGTQTAVGGAVTTLGGAASEFIFSGTGSGNTRQLVLTLANTDFYSFSLATGQLATVALKHLTGSGATISIQDAAGNTLASGVTASTNVDQVINNFVAPATGTYYVVVTGNAAATYSLVVTRDAAFDTEFNDTFATAQPLAASGGTLGAFVAPPIVPSTLATTEGNTNNNFPFNISSGTMRYQQLYARAEFSQPGTITAIRFRRDVNPTTFTASNNISVKINLGYAAAFAFASPSTTFANNVGAGTTTVIDTTSLVLSSTGTGTPNPFDIVIPLTTPFTYDPSQGDLLMDVFMRNVPGTRSFDAATSSQQSVTKRLFAADVNASTATTSDGTGLITRFDLAASDDWYTLDVTSTTTLRLETGTPADGPNQFVNTLNPHLELYDPANNLVATGSSLADARNEFLLYTPITTGTFRVRVTAEGGTAGEYFLTRRKALYWDPDGISANNNIATGAGLGGSGTWNTSTANWFNGVTDVAWNNANNDVATFAGTSGTVTLGTAITAAALTVNTTGYIVNSNTLTLAAGGVHVATGTITVQAQIAGTAGLTTTGTGTLILTGASSYSGSTTIGGGTLQVGSGGTVGALGTGPVIDNATLTFNRSNSITIANSISGTGNLTKLGAGVMTLTAANRYAGTTTISAGTLQLGIDNAIPSTSAVSLGNVSGAILNLNGFSDTIGSLTGGGTTGGVVALGSGTLSVGGNNSTTIYNGVISGAGNLTKQGTGTFTLVTGTNTYAGTTTISAGTLQIGNNGVTGSLGTGPVVDNSQLTFFRTSTFTVANAITGTGNLTKTGSGTAILTGVNSYAGITTISNGTLQVGNGGTTGALGAGLVINNATLNFNRSNSLTVPNIITGSGALIKSGAGTTTLSGDSVYAGATTVNAGALLIAGSITSSVTINSGGTLGGSGTVNRDVFADINGHVAPGTSPGILHVASIDLFADSSLDVQINGLVAGSQSDQLAVSGPIFLEDALLNVSGTFAVSPGTLQSVTIIDNQSNSFVFGLFAGLPEGSPIVVPTVGTLYITYRGGDGNDVVLNSQPVFNGTGADDAYVLVRDAVVATDYRLSINGEPDVLYHNPPNITINGLDGNDTLTLDFSQGQTIPVGGLVYNAGSQFSASGDVLRVLGTGAEAASYTPDGTSNPGLGMDGDFTIDGRPVHFSGLEPLDVQNVAAFTLNLPGANDIINVADGTLVSNPALAAIVLSGTSGGVSFEEPHLRNVGTVTVDTTGVPGSDTINLNSVTSAHGNTNLTVMTGAQVGDVIKVNANVVFAGTVNLASQRIDFDNPTSVLTADSVILNSGSGPISDASKTTPSVVANSLSASAGSGLTLGTNVNTIVSASATTGLIDITEADAVLVSSVVSGNGPIAITAGGTVTVGSIVSLGDNDANDISIISSSGDLNVATITAGAGENADVTLQAPSGSIFDDSVNGSVIQADVLTLAASRSIGQPGAVAQLDSAAKSLVAATTGAGPFSGPPTPGIWVTDNDSLTINSATTVDGVIFIDTQTGTLTATLVQAGGANRMARLDALGGDFTGTTVRSLGANVTIQASGNLSLPAGSLTTAAGVVTLTSLAGASTFNFAGDVDAASLQINGSGQADVFNIKPDQDAPPGPGNVLTPMSIDGKAPTAAPGDALTLDIAGLGVPTLTIGAPPRSGTWSFGTLAAAVTYQDIENVSSTPALSSYNVVLDMALAGYQDGAADTVAARPDSATAELVVAINGDEKFRGSPLAVRLLTILGSADNELFDVAPFPLGGPVVTVNGGSPGGPAPLPFGDTVGDKLKLDMSVTSGPVIVVTINGTATSTSHQPFSFTGIEDIDLVDGNLPTNVQMGDLYVRGTDGNDTIQFGSGGTNLSRTRINNYIVTLPVTMKTVAYGRGGNDYLQQTNLAKPGEFYGEGGDDYLSGYTGNELLVGGPGIDRLMGGDGDNELWGDNLGEQDLAAGGNDILSGGNGVDKVYGGGGNDQISTLGGNDYVYGGAGDDSIDGGAGDDRLYGGDGNDTIGGSTGNDLIAGNAGDDKLYGKDGNDVLIGGTGADLVMGENGNDLLFDGTVTYDDPNSAPPIGNDSSHAFGDASDFAMTALLADWSTDSAIAAAFLASTHDSFLDSLSGGDGSDTASPGSSPTDTGDWEFLI